MEPNCFTSSAVTPQGYKAGVVAPAQRTSYHMIFDCFSTFVPTAEKKEKIEKHI
jgi:hypothetical protein